MSAPNPYITTADQLQRYAAAESLLQHSRLPRNDAQNLNGFLISGTPSSSQGFQTQSRNLTTIPVQEYSEFGHPHRDNGRDQLADYDGSVEVNLDSPQDTVDSPSIQTRNRYSERAEISGSMAASNLLQANADNAAQSGYRPNRHGSLDDSEAASPTSSRGFTARSRNGARSNVVQVKADDDMAGLEDKPDSDRPPPWSELKTKAGKERKRLPLACIACRRKKIRCSGEKPACKHCLRSRIPCVYKVTARKAAPRTDYMAMLDKRLKRMEERVIKLIPKEQMGQVATIGRANVRPSALGQDGKVHGGKKRAAGEAFGPDLEEWAQSKTNNVPLKGLEQEEKAKLSEGTESLPSKEIQEHLSEVFFEYIYGQSYHILHKPSFMRKLRAGTVPPVLILAVCAISARFSTHPAVSSEPAFLRGEDWAAPARDIVLRRYDEPNITILTALLILGLHEFGTCQGGRSWMLCGMAMRMAYALQLHRELDHDPLGQKNGKNSELSFIDREIRRRTMWACFIMDRFNSSGTERPTCVNEETIKVQLPIKESLFQMEIPGSTESLDGDVPNPALPDIGLSSNPKDNMGVAAYMIRILAIWGRVIKYLNLGGKESDAHPIWKPESGFTNLKRQAENFRASLPSSLQNNQDNLKNHAAEKIANQFIFMHIASYQVMLFLHCFAVPTTPGARLQPEMPKIFVAEAGRAAVEAASQISLLLKDALDHLVVAPFAGYCAFMSSTVQVWGIFSKNPALEETSRRNLNRNVQYLSTMKKYWGMFHFIGHNLKDIYRQHADASRKGLTAETSKQDSGIFQYGDWFQKYPHGVSTADYEDPVTEIKKEPGQDAVLSQRSDLQSVEEFFNSLSPRNRAVPNRKAPKKAIKKPFNATPSPILQLETTTPQIHPPLLPLQLSNAQPPISPARFSPQQTPVFFPSSPGSATYPQTYDLLPQLDRQLVYGAYAGLNPSASAFNALTTHYPGSESTHVNTPDFNPGILWNAPAPIGDLDFQQQQQQQVAMQAVGQGAPYEGMGDVHTSAWFMPFNLNPPDIVTEGNEFGRGDYGGYRGGFGMGS